eukprot:scaffold13868_cov15-Tisochrysis_lutea.AAC.1
MIIEKWAVPIHQGTGLKVAHTKPIPKGQLEDDAAKFAGLLPAGNIHFKNKIMMASLSVTH